MSSNETEPLIVAFDAATPRRSVAVMRGAEVLAATPALAPEDSRHPAAASNTLLRDIDEVLRAAKAHVRDVQLFAATCGPGSFMGARAALSTLEAFAYTLRRPALGVPTLCAVARAALDAENFFEREEGKERAPKNLVDFEKESKRIGVVAYTPAGRGELFAQAFLVKTRIDDATLALKEATPPAHLAPAKVFEMAENLSDFVVWGGCGDVANFAETLRGKAADLNEGCWFSSEIRAPLAPSIGKLALAEFRRALALNESVFDNPNWRRESRRALYVRPSDAELKRI